MLEDLGNCVKIHETVIPAVNIQVEGFPQFVDDTWYGIYFEILMETGGLWIVEQYHQDAPIECGSYPFWAEGDKEFEIPCTFDNWEEFLKFWGYRAEVEDEYRAMLWATARSRGELDIKKAA